MRIEQRIRRILIVALLLYVATYLPRSLPHPDSATVVAQDPGDGGVVGAPGPGAVGVSVDPHQLTAPAQDEAPPEPLTVPRRYPVDQQTYEGMKAQANAEAAADAAREEAP